MIELSYRLNDIKKLIINLENKINDLNLLKDQNLEARLKDDQFKLCCLEKEEKRLRSIYNSNFNLDYFKNKYSLKEFEFDLKKLYESGDIVSLYELSEDGKKHYILFRIFQDDLDIDFDHYFNTMVFQKIIEFNSVSSDFLIELVHYSVDILDNNFFNKVRNLNIKLDNFTD